jgi:tetratricopeptide (TPR) repeat protein
MVDVRELAEELVFERELPNLTEIRGQVDGYLSEGALDKARLALEECRELSDDVRSGAENTWLYGHLGRIYRTEGRNEKALESLTRAFEWEPRDLGVSQALSELLVDLEQFERGLEVTRLLLLNHKAGLPESEIAAIYRRMGALYEGEGEFEKARAAYEKSLQKEPENSQALTGLLRVVGEVGEPGDVIDARLKLIRSLEDARARSTALVALGVDWIQKFNDPGRALDTLEEAVSEWPENQQAVEKIAFVAGEMGDWRRVCRAYFTLSLLVDKPAEKAEFLIRSSDVARRELWEAEKALAGYRKALDHDPTRLDAFKAVTSILVDARDWENLEKAYLQLISVNQERDGVEPELLAVLWEKLADLYSEHLGQVDEAIFAYEQAILHANHKPEVRLRIVELSEEREGHYDLAAEKLRELVELEPHNHAWLDRLGRVFLRQKNVDAAFCVFRALKARGADLDSRASGFLDRFESGVARPVKGQITPALMKRFLFSEELNPLLNDVFSLLKGALEEWTGESRRKYGLRRKDRVDLREPLAFVNFYKQVGATLGYVDLPDLWRKADQRGLTNGALIPAGLIVGEEQLISSREKHIAFQVAKQLFLFLSPFYLATIRPLSDLQAFFLLATALARPDVGVPESVTKESAFKALKKQIKGDDLRHLGQCIDQLDVKNREISLGPWVEAIEDSANRVGFLFCDDLRVVEESLSAEPMSLGMRSVADRMTKLIDYSISEKYLSLRPQLGIEVA